jgi:D-tyrosyl-tRNA(Tyr) deacylase
MKVLLQRIKQGAVTVDGELIGKTGPGLCLFLGVAKGDSESDAARLAERATELRIFEDSAGKMNLSLKDVNGEVLIVSEFTLYGDCARGRRPSFSEAAAPAEAERLYDHFVEQVKHLGFRVATGRFQAKMDVQVINDGPVTFILDSPPSRVISE